MKNPEDDYTAEILANLMFLQTKGLRFGQSVFAALQKARIIEMDEDYSGYKMLADPFYMSDRNFAICLSKLVDMYKENG